VLLAVPESVKNDFKVSDIFANEARADKRHSLMLRLPTFQSLVFKTRHLSLRCLLQRKIKKESITSELLWKLILVRSLDLCFGTNGGVGREASIYPVFTNFSPIFAFFLRFNYSKCLGGGEGSSPLTSILDMLLIG